MQSTRLVIKTAEITPEGLLIRSMEVIDGATGENLRIANLTPELLEFLKMIEIDVTKYFKVMEMKRKNPNLTQLADTFKLTLKKSDLFCQ
jgi:hypothetical protein